jgi:hypothetical protein
MAEGTVRFDCERVLTQHPSWRLFLAHPALGLAEQEGEAVAPPALEDLGVRWLSLARDEQEARVADHLRALLTIAARGGGARFEALAIQGTESGTALAARTGGDLQADGTVTGRLTPSAIDALVSRAPQRLSVETSDELAIVVEDRDAVGVLLDRWKADRLQHELEAAWGDAAAERADRDKALGPGLRRDRAVDRALRAHALVAWRRRAWMLLAAAVVTTELLNWEPLGEIGTTAAIVFGGMLLVLMPLDRLIEHWYHRSARG